VIIEDDAEYDSGKYNGTCFALPAILENHQKHESIRARQLQAAAVEWN
jgi:hypothetical protein